MNVTQLIERLERIEDKNKTVKISVNGIVSGDFHLNDAIANRLYLTNKGGKGYKEPELD